MAKILVTDDEEDIVLLISRYAEHEGHMADTAKSSKEAVRLCEQNDYDVIVMDIMMPDMDGYTASFNALSVQIKEPESQMTANGDLQKQIVNYAEMRAVYVEYRKAGYSKKFRIWTIGTERLESLQHSK